MSEGKLKNCHCEAGQSPEVAISDKFSLSYVRENPQQDIVLSGNELEKLFNLTQSTSPLSSPSEERKNKRIILSIRENIMITCFSLLTTFPAHASCTPTPDCVSIGYTETSCETKSVKCPFDTSKLFCIPCDSSFQYLCNNTNEYGVGDSCGGKYQFCCNTSCSVGAIYYADGSCNSCLDNSKTAIGIVVKDNELITSLNVPDMQWSSGYIDVTGITNFENSADAQNDIDGQSNTNAIIAQYGDTINASTNAGVFCYTYTPTGLESSKNKWYLPSAGEIYSYIASNYQKIKTGWNIAGTEKIDNYFWSSSESGLYGAWIVDVVDVNLISNSGTKHYLHSVACFMKI